MEKRTIEIIEGRDVKITKVEAHIFTHPLDETIEFGVHPTVFADKSLYDNTWSVTHIESGCCFDRGFESRERAVYDTVNQLKEFRGPKEQSLKNFKEVIKAVPPLNKVKLNMLYKEKS